MRYCLKCKGKLEAAVKLISYRGRSTLINVLNCVKCDETYSSINESEKARLNLNPGFFERLKGLFGLFKVDKITEAIIKGRVL